MLTALAALGASAPAYAQRSDTPQSYSIQAGSLGDALNQLARQSKLQIVYSPELVRGKTASAISGQLTWRAALERLLAGSDLRSEEHTSELQSLMRSSYAVLCLK